MTEEGFLRACDAIKGSVQEMDLDTATQLLLQVGFEMFITQQLGERNTSRQGIVQKMAEEFVGYLNNDPRTANSQVMATLQ